MMSCKLNKQSFSFLCILAALIMPFLLRLTGNVVLLTSQLQIILLSFLLTVVWLVNFKSIMNSGNIIVLLCNLIMLIINISVNGSLGVVITFYNVCLSLLIFNNISFTEKQVKIIRLFTIILLILLLASFSYEYQYGTLRAIDKGTTINTNTLGLLYLILFYNIFCFIYDSSLNKTKKNILLVFITAILSIFIWFSNCRSAITAEILFFVFLFVKKFNFKKMILLFILVGLIFPIIYVQLYHAISEDIEILGKSLFSGREKVWVVVWNIIKQSPIFGNGTTSLIEWGNGHITDSSHNTYLGFWKTLGIFPVISFIYFLLKGKNLSNIYTKNLIYKKAFVACMFICIVETLFNDANYNFLFLLLLFNIENRAYYEEVKI